MSAKRWIARLALFLARAAGVALAAGAIFVGYFNFAHQPQVLSDDERIARDRAQAAARAAGIVLADDIPVAHTPPGGYGNAFPKPVLASCTEPVVEPAPDLRGIWKTIAVERGGRPAPASDRVYHYVERIEQCGNRIVDMGGGTIADARADGTVANGVHDVSVFDYKTPIHVIASYEDGVLVLRPLPIPYVPIILPGIEVTRRLDANGRMIWTRPDLGGLKVTLQRIGKPTDPYTRRDLPDSTTGGRE